MENWFDKLLSVVRSICLTVITAVATWDIYWFLSVPQCCFEGRCPDFALCSRIQFSSFFLFLRKLSFPVLTLGFVMSVQSTRKANRERKAEAEHASEERQNAQTQRTRPRRRRVRPGFMI